MVVVMAPEATQADIDQIVALVGAAGGEAFVSRGLSRTIIGLVGDVAEFGSLNLRSYRGVSDVIRISVPYKLVSRENQPGRSTVTVAGVPIGPDQLTVVAGGGAARAGGRSLSAAGRRLQATDLAVRVPGPRRGRTAHPRGRQG
jgi:3-deoxy-7-phosphoheptulonate synthase